MSFERRNDYRGIALSDEVAASLTEGSMHKIPMTDQDMRTIGHESTMHVEKFVEAEKTEEQEKVIVSVIETIRQTLDELGFAWVGGTSHLRVDHIHIITDESYYRGLPETSAGFFVSDGNIYIPESGVSNTVDFITTLTHEISHEVSYQEMGRLLVLDDEDKKKKDRWILDGEGPYSKAGIAERHNGEDMYRGYMEAVNELLSVEFSKQAAKKLSVSKHDKKALSEPQSYHDQILFLQTIIDQVVEHTRKETGNNHTDEIYNDVMAEIFGDHIGGTYNFLDRLYDMWPTACKELIAISDNDVETVITAAARLGLKDVAKEIANRHGLELVG